MIFKKPPPLVEDNYYHIIMHNYFKERVLELKKNKFEQGIESNSELIVFLGKWLLHHVIEDDKKIVLNPKKESL